MLGEPCINGSPLQWKTKCLLLWYQVSENKKTNVYCSGVWYTRRHTCVGFVFRSEYLLTCSTSTSAPLTAVNWKKDIAVEVCLLYVSLKIWNIRIRKRLTDACRLSFGYFVFYSCTVHSLETASQKVKTTLHSNSSESVEICTNANVQ